MVLSSYICLFFIYSLMGWIYETLFCTIKNGKWENSFNQSMESIVDSTVERSTRVRDSIVEKGRFVNDQVNNMNGLSGPYFALFSGLNNYKIYNPKSLNPHGTWYGPPYIEV